MIKWLFQSQTVAIRCNFAVSSSWHLKSWTRTKLDAEPGASVCPGPVPCPGQTWEWAGYTMMTSSVLLSFYSTLWINLIHCYHLMIGQIRWGWQERFLSWSSTVVGIDVATKSIWCWKYISIKSFHHFPLSATGLVPSNLTAAMFAVGHSSCKSRVLVLGQLCLLLSVDWPFISD